VGRRTQKKKPSKDSKEADIKSTCDTQRGFTEKGGKENLSREGEMLRWEEQGKDRAEGWQRGE